MIVRSRLAFTALREQFVNKLFWKPKFVKCLSKKRSIKPSFLVLPCLTLKEIILHLCTLESWPAQLGQNTSAGLPFMCVCVCVPSWDSGYTNVEN